MRTQRTNVDLFDIAQAAALKGEQTIAERGHGTLVLEESVRAQLLKKARNCLRGASVTGIPGLKDFGYARAEKIAEFVRKYSPKTEEADALLAEIREKTPTHYAHA